MGADVRVYTAADVAEASALTVCQPHAHRIALGLKPVENRDHDKYNSYRGVLLIHAGKSRAWLEGDEADYPAMPFGAIEAVVTVTDAVRHGALPPALRDHEHTHGPFCLVLSDVYRLTTPVPCNGRQGLWRPEPSVLAAVMAQLTGSGR